MKCSSLCLTKDQGAHILRNSRIAGFARFGNFCGTTVPPGQFIPAGSAFARISIENEELPAVKVSSSLVRNPALPTRNIPLSPDNQKPEEPTLKDWDGAAMFNLHCISPDDFTPSNMSLRMGIDYAEMQVSSCSKESF